jgi:methylated-DNA-[protein]-cysteine S-methyltransferase
MYTFYHPSPIGRLEIEADDTAILEIGFPDASFKPSANKAASDTIPSIIKQCIAELDEYFEGKRKTFTVPYRFARGTDFQKSVWTALEKIPYGTTVTYSEQALKLGNLKAIRAVGTSNGANPIAIIVPCHRVIGANGKLTGYAGDVWAKEWLLKHEGAITSLF